jgi:hypothetical protein
MIHQATTGIEHGNYNFPIQWGIATLSLITWMKYSMTTDVVMADPLPAAVMKNISYVI